MFKKLTFRAKILIAVALACAGYVVLMPATTQTVEPMQRADAAPTAHVTQDSARSPIINAALRLKDRIVKDTAAASLFSVQSWYVAPPPPPPPPPRPVQAPPAPTAPPLPFAFMGSYRPEGAPPTFFLTSGDRVYDVKVGDTLDNKYRVDAIKSGQLLLTYMPLQIQQSLAVGDDK